MERKMPDNPSLEGLEKKWSAIWEKSGIYKFEYDKGVKRKDVYSIDTPPPTVSGSLHLGHVFSYTHTDIIARFKRMGGYKVFYPMGWDDNGLPTERRVQNYYNVRCDPQIEYDPNLKIQQFKELRKISRPNFIEFCLKLTKEDEKVFEDLWRTLGLSVDWSNTYSTIDELSRKTSQASFLRLLEKGLIYQKEAPTLWDVDFQTAVAQAELKDVEMNSYYYTLKFKTEDLEDLLIETTRPELLPACVGVVFHPDDSRYKKLEGRTIITPLFSVPVKAYAHNLADPNKGTGLAMVCTFGDLSDVTWWKELNLDNRLLLGRDGKFKGPDFSFSHFKSLDPGEADNYYQFLAGLDSIAARKKIVEILKDRGFIFGEPRKINHSVKFYEKGEKPLEIIFSRQFYIRTMEYKEQLLELGRELNWIPAFMRHRYEAWVEGLNSDWNISRQRFFGVPFPVWYPLDGKAQPIYDKPILPGPESLPVDPSSDCPPGYSEDQRDKQLGFTAEKDVMDTWATSSLTPQIAGKKELDKDFFNAVFPMDLRPQAHEIIRTWLFVTVVKSFFEQNSLPFKNAAISGWILDPDRKKMSKSRGNVVVPSDLLGKYGSDAVRYWAAMGRPGIDTAIDEGQMRVGRRLAIKLLNASKFILTVTGRSDVELNEKLNPLDASFLMRFNELITQSRKNLEDYNYTKSLELAEDFFWDFCDNYIELVKQRVYREENKDSSGKFSLLISLKILLRLFAPFLPFVTEEIWSWFNEASVHKEMFPQLEELRFLTGYESVGGLYEKSSLVLSEIRQAKTSAKKSVKALAKYVLVCAPSDFISILTQDCYDLKAAGAVERLEFSEGEQFSVKVEL